MLRLAPFLSTYVDYCTSFTHAITALSDARDHRLSAAVRLVEQAPAARFLECAYSTCMYPYHDHHAAVLHEYLTAQPYCAVLYLTAQVLADLEFDDGAEDLEAPGAALLSYLIKPVQRLCQYPLLFRSIAIAYAGADGGAARRRGSAAATCPRTGAEKASQHAPLPRAPEAAHPMQPRAPRLHPNVCPGCRPSAPRLQP